jgi:hypothetical protein
MEGRVVNRRNLRWVALAALGAALVTGRTWPGLAPYAAAAFLAGAALTIATIRPDRGKS